MTDLGEEQHLAHPGAEPAYGVVRVTEDGGRRPLSEAELDRYEADYEVWQEARTVRELAWLAADWLDGTCTYLPAYLAVNPDRETVPLLPCLLRANRAGYFTDSSQPGTDGFEGIDGIVRHQRAFVSGRAEPDVADRLGRAFGDDARFIYLARAEASSPARYDEDTTPVTVRERGDGSELRDVTTVAGTYITRDHVQALYAYELHPAAVEAICDAYQITIIDTEYGAHDRLWETLDRALADDAPGE